MPAVLGVVSRSSNTMPCLSVPGPSVTHAPCRLVCKKPEKNCAPVTQGFRVNITRIGCVAPQAIQSLIETSNKDSAIDLVNEIMGDTSLGTIDL